MLLAAAGRIDVLGFGVVLFVLVFFVGAVRGRIRLVDRVVGALGG